MSEPKQELTGLMRKIADEAWTAGAESGSAIVRDALAQAADAIPAKALTSKDIIYIVNGMIEVMKGKK